MSGNGMMKRYAPLFFTLLLLPPLASADIFKCDLGKGVIKYQNFPCPIDSIGSKATAPPAKEHAAKPDQQVAAAPEEAVQHKPPERGDKMNAIRGEWGAPKTSRVNKG